MSIVISTADNINLQSHAGLVASVQSRMDRTDLAGDIPDFIYLAERELERLLLSPYRETTDTVTVTLGVGTLPADYKAMRLALWGNRLLHQRSPQAVLDAPVSGEPVNIAVSGDSLFVSPSATGAVTLTYERSIPALTENAPSNWVLERHADLYLHGTLMHGFAHVADEERASTYRAMFLSGIEQVNEEGKRRRYSGTPLVPTMAAVA